MKPENILLAAGSGEILDVVGTTFLLGGKKVLGVEPSYSSVYQHATQHQVDGDQAAARQGLPAGHSGDDQGGERARARRSGSSICATRTTRPGSIVTKQEVKQLLDGIPKDMPVLIDEAYHHFVDDPELRDVGAVRARGTAGDHRAHVLEDRGARRHAPRLRDRDRGDRRRRCGRTAWAASTRS